MNDKLEIYITTKQDSKTSSFAIDKECAAVRRFKISSDRVELEENFRNMIRNEDTTSIAELESVIDICPDILVSFNCYTSGRTPLHEACCYRCSDEVIELLVRRHPDALWIADEFFGNLPLHYVLQDSGLSIVQLMIDTYPLSVQVLNKFGETPLHYACLHPCSFEVIEYLVDLYPQALQIRASRGGHTPLRDACCFGHSCKVIEFLIRQNPDVLQVVDSDGNLPLHYVHRCCDLSTVKLMIDTCPLSIQVLNNLKETPLHCACCNECSFEVIEFLVHLYSQALQMKNLHGYTPLYSACTRGNHLSVIQLLHTSFPLAVRWKVSYGDMPLLAAYNEGSMKVMKYLAYECWPLACPLLCVDIAQYHEKPPKCLKDATIEAIAALVDIAFHIKHILPDTATAHILESVMSFYDKYKTTQSPLMLSSGQHCELVLDKSDCRINLDYRTVLSILESDDVALLLEPEGGHDELQELIDTVIRMNRAGRAYFAEYPENRQQGLKVLLATTSLNGLFFHIRENPLLCKQT